MKSLRTAVFAAAAVLALTACPGTHREDYSQSGPSKGSTGMHDAQATPENSKALNPVNPPQKDLPGAHPVVANQTVDVQLTEYQIVMPDTLRAGTTTLNIVNGGKEDHSFVIAGNGYQAGLPEPLKRGDRHALDVNLKAGTYDVWCPVDGHKGKGMMRSVSVK